MADKPKRRQISVKIDLEEAGEFSYSNRVLASASLDIPLPADRTDVESSVGAMLETLVEQVTVFHGETVAVPKTPGDFPENDSVPEDDSLPI